MLSVGNDHEEANPLARLQHMVLILQVWKLFDGCRPGGVARPSDPLTRRIRIATQVLYSMGQEFAVAERHFLTGRTHILVPELGAILCQDGGV